MKIIIIILLLSQSLTAQIFYNTSIETGWKQGSYTIYKGNQRVLNYTYPNNSFYANINLSVKWKIIELSQNVNNSFQYKSGRTFSPKDIEFVSKVSFTHKYISLSYSHSCFHPVINSFDDFGQDIELMRMSMDKISIKFTFKN